MNESHLEMLRSGSGISDEVITERGYRTISASQGKEYGFPPSQCRSGLLMPVWTTDGKNPLYILRPDDPRLGKDGKPLKYEMPRGQSVRIDCPPRCLTRLADPSIPLWVTEGIKKDDAMASRGLCTIALLGVWNFKGRNDKGGITLLADFDYIALNGRQVYIVFDSDVMTKPQVRAALDRLIEHLQRKGAHVTAVYLPMAGGSKVGVDDFLLTHSVADLEGLSEGPRPGPKAAPPLVELLDSPPAKMTQALQLVDGRGYAAAWLWVKRTVTERTNSRGEIIRCQPPIEEKAKRLFVIRDDGVIFGDGGDQPLEELGLEVSLPTPPKDSKLWTTKGVKAYRAGGRPPPLDVFQRLVSLIDRFMSFDRSLADQNSMCELLSCYILTTWFLDAFNVIGFLWPNGTHGTGKTKLGILVCEVAYLGEVLLSGSTYACLRDLADLGAAMLFDDAEDLTDPKKADPDKRSLLLAGNRRGATIAVKEQGPDKTWRTRYVNSYGPRIFTAINLPDPVLASRTIVIPLVRAADPRKANSEVLDYAQWSCDQRQLLDDLWALALCNLSAMPAHDDAVGGDAPLLGRNLEPWRALLAVAHWLDSVGEAGLYQRMVNLAKSYQTERAELETIDLTKLVIRAMIELLAPGAPAAPLAPVVLGASEIADKVNSVAKDEDMASVNATPQSVGKVLSALRLERVPKTSGGSRKRKTNVVQLDSIARSYGFPPIITNNGTLPEEPGRLGQVGQVGRPDDDPVATRKAVAEVDL